MKLDRLVVASHNPDKIAEIEDVLGTLPVPVEVLRSVDFPEVDETEPTLEGNALLKARAVHRHTGLAALADDTGLEVDALGGAPGVRTARFSGQGATYSSNIAKLLTEMTGVVDRSARFRTAIAVVDTKGEERVVVGELEGVITAAPRGGGGFGYDPVFEVDGRTLAEMDVEEKNRISHRARALHALGDALRFSPRRTE